MMELEMRGRAKHAADIEELRRAWLTTRNEDRVRRAKFAAEMEEQRRASLTKSNEKNKARRATPARSHTPSLTPNV